jgi:predicted Rossmann fold nucleotide-binding protein DprA/Smf involved in DNA uptake
MKVIIAGSRGFNDKNLLFDYMDKYIIANDVDTVISGCAMGADTLGPRGALGENDRPKA